MNIRRRILPRGWYPDNENEMSAMISSWQNNMVEAEKNITAGIVPHAGWVFSGDITYDVVRRIPSEIETVVVVGGHMPQKGGILLDTHEGWETPTGIAKSDIEFSQRVEKRLSLSSDNEADNTVESVVPMVHYLYPDKRVLCLRVEQGLTASELGKALADIAKELGRKIIVLGSTDLTHYGPNYGFYPKGTGVEAENWVREDNDRRIIEALLNMDEKEALARGVEDRAACSVGAAITALIFAHSKGAEKGKLLAYKTSLDIHQADSFVGYAGIIYGAN